MERNGKNKHVLSQLAVMAASSGAVFTAGAAEARLVFEFWQQYSDVKMKVSGSLSAPSAGLATNNVSDLLNSSQALISTGSFATGTNFSLDSGANSFGSLDEFIDLSSYSGQRVFLRGSQSLFIDNFVSGATIAGSAVIANKSLTELGLSATPGILASWPISSSTGTVYVKVLAPVPGPLPVLGAGAAFGFSRRLRQRIQRSQVASRSRG